MSLCPVILAGGSGTRLWPLSREHYPKQFLQLFSQHSLLQETLLRLKGLDAGINLLEPLVVCNEEHRFLVAEQSAHAGIKLQSIILEPEGRNTAPALTVSGIFLVEKSMDPVMLMMPADHNINDPGKFHSAIKSGYHLALKGNLVTFGISPRRAETGYGYIKYGQNISCPDTTDVYWLEDFTEKPDAAIAEAYLASGNYLWNSGIFMMKASVWNAAIRRLHPDIYQACFDAFKKGAIDDQFFRLDKQAFCKCRSDSVDFAVMEPLAHEKAPATAVIKLDAGWSDVGTWSAVWESGRRDADNNIADGDVVLKDSNSNLVKAGSRLVAVLGCDHMLIVETPDAVMVADMDKAQEIRVIVEQLKASHRKESLTHRHVYRPWGSYETIDSGSSFQVKRLTVKPGKKLSLQSHSRRAEHWIVVNGTARVTRGEEIFLLQKNESTYIPMGTKHRLENTTDQPLEIIEVQSGSYLGEDDIVRYEDDFGRI